MFEFIYPLQFLHFFLLDPSRKNTIKLQMRNGGTELMPTNRDDGDSSKEKLQLEMDSNGAL